MTRMEKFKDLRERIEEQNISAIFTDFDGYLELITHQKEIKKESRQSTNS